MEKFTSLDTFIASNQMESDYKNLLVFYEDYKIFAKMSKQKISAQSHCMKYLESIIEQKGKLNINSEADIKMLHNIKFDV